jgi:predicted metal-binding membrane protein
VVVNTVRTDPAVLRRVLRRDRIIISLALLLLTALAWSYLWLSADLELAVRATLCNRMET